MTERRRRILIAEHEETLAGLMTFALEAEGYEVASFVESPALPNEPAEFLDMVGVFSPDLCIVDILPYREEAAATFLDRLRMDPRSAHVPVLTVTTSEDAAGRSVASYNVRETLTKPFDLDEMLEKVRSALGERVVAPSPPDSPCDADDVFCEAHRALAAHSREALFRWVQRLQTEPPFKGRKDLNLAACIDNVPILVEAVTAALAYRSAEELFDRNAVVLDRARHHAELRKSQAIPLESIVREYALLRDEITGIFARYLPKDLQTDGVLAMDRVVNLTLDRIISVTIPDYIQANIPPPDDRGRDGDGETGRTGSAD